MNELIKITYESDRPLVSARELHEFLEVETDFPHWFTRMCEYGFADGADYQTFLSDGAGFGKASVKKDAMITIDMAKELCMIQRNEKGKIARQYFIQLERDWNSPEKVMARALDIAHKTINSLKADNSMLTVQNTIMAPKADYFDQLVERNTLTNFRETAKQLEVPPKKFVQFLLDKKYVYRDKKGKLLPFEEKNKGLFEVKECVNEKTEWSGTQTFITPKGRETFRLLYV